jgi:hypothetical protein
MTTRSLLVTALVLLALAPVARAADDSSHLCSGGTASGTPCTSDAACPEGFCVRAFAVCDGGGADRFDCPCPGGACSRATACPGDADLGTCVGGARDGACCEPLLGCEDDAPCVATAKVCLGGAERGFGCRRDAHCPGSTCAAAARVCRGGIFAGAACADAGDCRGGACLGLTGPVGCPGDCDGSGDVTVDELVTMVNIALGALPVSACLAGDVDGSGQVTVDEVIATVNNALVGCLPPAAAR